MYDVAFILGIWILVMLIVIVCLPSTNPIVSTPISTTDSIGLPITGNPVGFKRSVWVNQLLSGTPTDFGCYSLTVTPNNLVINDQILDITPVLTNATPYMVEFNNSVSLVKGSPFIKTSILPTSLDQWYHRDGYIWLKLDLPSWYGDIIPILSVPHIKVTNTISITWDNDIYYWIPRHLISEWRGDILYQIDDKLLGYGKEWQYQYETSDYSLVDNLPVDLFDPSLKYNIKDGLIEPIDLVVQLVKDSYALGIPINQAQYDRLMLLSNSLLNHGSSKYFGILPIIDIYTMKVNNEQINLTDALNILGYLVKWNS